jgi:hypothetical protein
VADREIVVQSDSFGTGCGLGCGLIAAVAACLAACVVLFVFVCGGLAILGTVATPKDRPQIQTPATSPGVR